jgi:predicted amidohydrolase
MSGELGSLAVGSRADVAVLRIEEGQVPLRDAFNATETAARRLRAQWTIVAGEPHEADRVEIPLRPLFASDHEAGCGGPIE